jgi:hypothetical protein
MLNKNNPELNTNNPGGVKIKATGLQRAMSKE